MKALLPALILSGMTLVLPAAEPDKTEAAAEPAFTLHEWGTFTTVSGSDGVLLPGLDRDEEQLPDFVSGHSGMQAFTNRQMPGDPNAFLMIDDPSVQRAAGKGLYRPVEQVTVKMETPVIYIYSDASEPFHLDLKVGFKQGLISQFFPGAYSVEQRPVAYEPIADSPLFRIKPLDFSTPQNGHAHWLIKVHPKSDIDDFRIIKPHETTTWIRPRVRDANLISMLNDQQPEGFVFYRGLGHFDIPLTTTMKGRQLHLNSECDLSYALVFQGDGYRARVLWDGPLTAGKTKTVETVDQGNWRELHYLPGIQVDLLTRMQRALVKEGLSRDEASAMLRTWWDSYFCQPGLRVFWMVPRERTDAILPLTISKQPTSMERVLVGRAEVLSPAFEAGLPGTLQHAGNRLESDRYYAAYRARVRAMKPEFKLPKDPYDRRFELRRVERTPPKPAPVPTEPKSAQVAPDADAPLASTAE